MLLIWGSGLNKPLFYMINSLHVYFPDLIWVIMNTITYPKLFILPIILLVITWLYKKEQLLNVILIIVSYYVVFLLIKVFSAEPRPYAVLPMDSFYLMQGIQDMAGDAFLSFPSGHAGNAAVFVFTLNRLIFDKKIGLRFVMYAFLLLVALARVCTGWHWPLDVMASIFVGYLIVLIEYSINLSSIKRKINL